LLIFGIVNIWHWQYLALAIFGIGNIWHWQYLALLILMLLFMQRRFSPNLARFKVLCRRYAELCVL
jgi:hypothetical protein